MDELQQLQDWYASQCNEDWEHTFGVKIDTLDNPGWTIKVDLGGTPLEGKILAYTLNDRSEHDWIGASSDGTTFEAAGGPLNLRDLVEAFSRFANPS